MDDNPLFIKMSELKNRFWDMFIVDSLIGNNDRNNGNWGVIVNNRTGDTKIAPVFDNGAAFSNKMGEPKMKRILSDKERFITSAYTSRRCVFSEDGIQINPLKYIEEMKNRDCNEAILRVVPDINMNLIKNLIYSVENEYKEIKVTSDIQKEFYIKTLEYRYNKILLPTLEKLKSKI